MPIGPITPGDPVTVTPDVSPTLYGSIQAPTATMPILGAHLQALTLVLLNIQKFLDDRKLDKIDGGVVSGPVDFTGIIDFQATGANRPQFQGGWRIVAGGGAISAGDLGLSNGSAAISIDLTVGADALIAGDLTVGQTLHVPIGGTLAVESGGSFSLHAGSAALISTEVGMEGSIDLINTGYISQRQGVQSTNANTVIGALDYTTYKIPNGVLSATRLLTINTGPSGKHPRIRIWSEDGAFGMDLRNQGGGVIGGTVIAKASLGPGEYRWVDIEWNGSSTWEIVGGERS